MASGTRPDIQKALKALKGQAQTDLLKFEIKQRDLKINQLKMELTNLRLEIEKLKKAKS